LKVHQTYIAVRLVVEHMLNIFRFWTLPIVECKLGFGIDRRRACGSSLVQDGGTNGASNAIEIGHDMSTKD